MTFICGPTPKRHPQPESAMLSTPEPKLLMLPIGFPLQPMDRSALFDYAKRTRQYWEASSYGAVVFDYDAVPNYPAPGPAPVVCDPNEYTTGCLDASRFLGYEGSHPVYMIGKLECSWGGTGNVGYPPAWINADQPFGNAVTHEIGHNIGFGHAHGLYPGYDGTQEVTTWKRVEYGDSYSVMGSGFNHCSALEKERLGWIPPIRTLNPSAYVRVVLAPLEGATGERAARINRGVGSYCLEYRQPVGYDANIGGELGLVRLDYTDGFTLVATLIVGETFTDSAQAGGVIIRFNGGGQFDIATLAITPQPLPPFIPYTVPFVTPPALSPVPEDFVSNPPTELFLGLGQRFKVSVKWTAPPAQAGDGTAIPLTQETGSFWFFNPSNYELMVKVLDGHAVNGNWWFFYGSLSNVQFTITLTDTETGHQRKYDNPQGTMASVGDTAAFVYSP